MADEVIIYGLAAPFTAEAMINADEGPFLERFAPCAFDRALGLASNKNGPVLSHWHHDLRSELGSTHTGTLRQERLPSGLMFTLRTRALTDAARAEILAGKLGASIGFSGLDVVWDRVYGMRRRTVIDAELAEVSLTARPAYRSTWVRLVSKSATLRERLAEDLARRERRAA